MVPTQALTPTPTRRCRSSTIRWAVASTSGWKPSSDRVKQEWWIRPPPLFDDEQRAGRNAGPLFLNDAQVTQFGTCPFPCDVRPGAVRAGPNDPCRAARSPALPKEQLVVRTATE